MKHEESNFNTRDGINIFYQVWRPEGTPKGIIQVVHGLAEHAGRYMHVVNKLVPNGFIVYGNDHRGHGRSGGHPGFVKSVDDFVQDQKEFITLIRSKEGKKLPIFIIGHSMGSIISILYVADHPDEFKGLILSGTGNASGGVKTITIFLAKVLSKFLPKGTMKNELSDGVSRDSAVIEAYNNDPYVLKKITFRLASEVLKGMNMASERIKAIKIPLLIQKGGKDPIVIGLSELFARVTSKDSTLKIYDELYHEVYNELEEDRNIVLNDLTDWLNAHL